MPAITISILTNGIANSKNLISINEYIENSMVKKQYSITAEGLAQFKDWIETPMNLKKIKNMEYEKLTQIQNHVQTVKENVIQIFALIVVLQGGGYLGLWFSVGATRVICYVFSCYLILNSFMRFFSRSKKEKYVMTPMSLFAAVCFFNSMANELVCV